MSQTTTPLQSTIATPGTLSTPAGGRTDIFADAMARSRREKRKKTFAQVILAIILLIGAIFMIFPFVWMIASSLKNAQDIYTLSIVPPNPTLDNYRTVLQETSYVRWFINSIVVAGITTLSVAFFDSLAGYTLAKFKFPGATIIFVLILSTLMVPTEMLVIPWYVMSIEMSWTDSYWGVMFPGVMSAFGVFLMRAILPRRAERPDRRRPAGWLLGVPHLLEYRPAAGEASGRRALHLHLPR